VIDERQIKSLREWLASWGDEPNWFDVSGQSVPITKVVLTSLLDDLEKCRRALREIRTCALERAVGMPADSLMRASVSTIADEALEGQ
jgi:hypothetical protein